MPTTSKKRPGYGISGHLPKHILATLIQGFASTLRHQLFEHGSHCLYSVHQFI
jgi:hypothetical protein